VIDFVSPKWALDIIGCFIIGYNGYPFPLTQNMPPTAPKAVEKAGSSLAVLRASANTWEDQETSRDAETGQVGRSAELALRHLNIIYIYIYCTILNTYIYFTYYL
jgi:hypothetical protein